MYRLYGSNALKRIKSPDVWNKQKHSLMKSLLLVASIVAATSTNTNSVQAEDNAPTEQFTFSASPIEGHDTITVTASDGQTFDTIQANELKLHLRSDIRFKRKNGRVDRSGVYVGLCHTIHCGYHPMISYSQQYVPSGVATDLWNKIENKLYRVDRVISFPANRIPVTNVNGIAPIVFGDHIVNECNARATSSLINNISFTYDATLSLSVNTRTADPSIGANFVEADEDIESINDVEFNGGDKSKQTTVTFNINCTRASVNEGYGLNFDHGDLKATSIKLFLTTPNTIFTTPRPDRRCEVGVLTVKLETNQPDLVSFKLFKKKGGVITNEDVIIGTHHKNGRYVGVHKRNLTVSETTSYQFKARDLVNETFYNETDWKILQLNCEGSDIGGFAEDTSPQDDALDPVVASWDGEIIIADGNAPQGEYKRPAQVFFQVEREQSGNFGYHISCSNGRSFQGSATSFNSGGSKWKAFGTHNFNMLRPMVLQCLLREVKSNGKTVSIDKTSFRFVGGTVNPDLGGSTGDLVSPDKDDDHGLPTAKPMTGGFAFVDNSNAAKQNICERSSKALVWFDTPKNDNIHYSLDCGDLGNFSGVLQPKSIGNNRYRAGKIINFQVKKTIQAGCTLRTVSPGVAKDHAFKSKTFQCVKSAGHSSGIDGITTPSDPQTKTAPVLISPVKPKPKVAVCRGGNIKNGKCFCAKGKTRKKVSRFEYLCKRDRIATPSKPEKPKKPVRVNPPKPKKVKEPVRTNPKPKKKKKIACIGGKVRGGKCTCRSNKLRKKIGKRKFQCIVVAKPPKPKKPVRVNPKPKLKKKALICKGGKVRGGKCRCPKGRLLKKQGKRKFLCFRPAG